MEAGVKIGRMHRGGHPWQGEEPDDGIPDPRAAGFRSLQSLEGRTFGEREGGVEA